MFNFLRNVCMVIIVIRMQNFIIICVYKYVFSCEPSKSCKTFTSKIVTHYRIKLTLVATPPTRHLILDTVLPYGNN